MHSLLIALPCLLAAAAVPPLPATPKKPVVDDYHGVKVEDDYRWLESWNEPGVRNWSEAENAHARAVLDAIPFRAALERRMTQLLSWESPAYLDLEQRGGRVVGSKWQPPKQQPVIVWLPSLDELSKERVVVDPNAIDPSGSTSIDFFKLSLDGRYVAVSLSRGGTESGDVHVFRVETGEELHGDVVPRANSGTAGGSVAWAKDGFWYTRHPAEGERPKEDLGFWQQIWFHKLGTPTAQDTYSLGKEFPRIAETVLVSSDDGKYLLALVEKGDGGEYELHLLDAAKNGWAKIASYGDQAKLAVFGRDDSLWLLSRKDAPRGKVLHLPAGGTSLAQAKLVVRQDDGAIQDVLVGQSRLFLTEEMGGPERMRVLDFDGKLLGDVPLLPVSAIPSAVWLGGDEIAFANTSYVKPVAWYRFDARSGKTTATALAQTSPVDFSDVEVVREEAVSKDGTRVPLTILKPKGVKLDGTNPTLLTAYGGFDISISPRYLKLSHAWLEQGGIVAEANLRGGGEFGEEWHRAGAGTRKQNVFGDFIACARHLVARKYTSPQKLAIEGRSNGGLLVGAALTQAPDLFRAVVAHVGLFDMLRFETSANGAFNTSEFGTVKDAADFKALAAYSPYQHVKDGTKYPPTLFLTGANDPRVDPMHSRKMVARLQSAGAVALLRTSSNTGHLRSPLKEQIAESVDSYAFMMQQLGVRYRPVPKPAAAPSN
jgi:prolyl oligopeptidase